MINVNCLLYKIAVYIEVFERNVFCTFYVISIFGNIIKMGIFNADVIYVLIIVETNNEDTELAFFAGHIFQVDVADSGSEATVAIFTVLVLQVDAQHGFAALAYGDVTHEHIFNQSATAGAGLDTDDAVEVRAVHFAIFHIQVTVSTGDFTADDYSAVSFLHITATYNDVFAGNAPLAPVLVTTGFDGNTVVASIESTIFYQYVFTGFGVAAVTVGTTVINIYATHDKAFAE